VGGGRLKGAGVIGKKGWGGGGEMLATPSHEVEEEKRGLKTGEFGALSK